MPRLCLCFTFILTPIPGSTVAVPPRHWPVLKCGLSIGVAVVLACRHRGRGDRLREELLAEANAAGVTAPQIDVRLPQFPRSFLLS